PGGGVRYGSARIAVSSEESRAYALGVGLASPSAASVQVASSSAPSVQVASVQVASVQVASVQVASVQVASVQVASVQVAASQAGLFLTASSQVAQSKTGVDPPVGSGPTNLSSARFGFGGALSDAALPALSSPAPTEFGVAFGAFFAVASSAPLTWSGVQLGWRVRISCAAPATAGDAKDVPESWMEPGAV